MPSPSPSPAQGLDKFVVRLPDGMREKVGALARANKRTMNAEIVSRLEASFVEAKPPFMVIETNTAAADILMELPGSIQSVRNEIAELKSVILKLAG